MTWALEPTAQLWRGKACCYVNKYTILHVLKHHGYMVLANICIDPSALSGLRITKYNTSHLYFMKHFLVPILVLVN